MLTPEIAEMKRRREQELKPSFEGLKNELGWVATQAGTITSQQNRDHALKIFGKISKLIDTELDERHLGVIGCVQHFQIL